MNKKLIFGSACLGLILVLSGCGTGNQTSNQAAKQKSNQAEGRPDRMPDFGQPKTQPEARGVVKSVVGNEVTILKIDQPQRATSTDSGTASSTKRNNLSLNGGAGRGAGGMGMMGGERQRGANSETDRATLMEQMKAMSTGEETITIPVGIKMLKAGTDNPRNMVEANISDVVADKMITVWLDSSVTDKKVASFVLIN